MKMASGTTRNPFVGTVEALVCRCDETPKELFTARTQDKAIAKMRGYWDVYLTFYGDQVVWLNFNIVDTRDGVIVWRNGHPMKEETHGRESEDGERGIGREGGPDVGRWLIGERHLDW